MWLSFQVAKLFYILCYCNQKKKCKAHKKRERERKKNTHEITITMNLLYYYNNFMLLQYKSVSMSMFKFWSSQAITSTLYVVTVNLWMSHLFASFLSDHLSE